MKKIRNHVAVVGILARCIVGFLIGTIVDAPKSHKSVHTGNPV